MTNATPRTVIPTDLTFVSLQIQRVAFLKLCCVLQSYCIKLQEDPKQSAFQGLFLSLLFRGTFYNIALPFQIPEFQQKPLRAEDLGCFRISLSPNLMNSISLVDIASCQNVYGLCSRTMLWSLTQALIFIIKALATPHLPCITTINTTILSRLVR